MSKFGAIPTAIICRFGELTKTEIIVLSYLYSARNSQSGVCNPRQKTIAMMTGINKTHVSAAIKNLANRGWISMDNDGQFMLIDAPKKVTKFVTKSYGIGNSEVTKSVTKVTDSVTKSYEIGNLHNIDINNERNNEVTTKETGTEMLSVYREFFPENHLSIYLQELIADNVTNEPRWREALAFWKDNDYRPNSVGKIVRYYSELGNKQNGNSKKSNIGRINGKSGSQSTAEYLASIGANPAA